MVSRDGTAIPNAVVLLLDEMFQPRAELTTDHGGRFAFEGLDPGEYVLTLERHGYPSIVSTPLVVDTGQTLVHRLVADARRLDELARRSKVRVMFLRRVTQACGDLAEREGRTALAGTVTDALSGLGVPGAEVMLRWQSENGEDVRTTAQTTEDGSYVFCDAPAGQEVTLAVEGLRGGGDLLATVLDPGTAHRLDLPVDLLEGPEPGQVVGRVLEYETGREISNAEIRLGGDDGVSAVTNSRGYFLLRDVRPGGHVLSVRHLGYGDREQSLVVLPGRAHEIEVRLAVEAIELEPIEVTVRSDRWMEYMEGLDYRMRRGFGYFMLREDIELRGSATHLGSLIEQYPGVRWQRRDEDYNGVITVYGCRPDIWLDGSLIREPGYVFASDGLRGGEVEAIEVYTHPGSAPPEYIIGNCGSIVIWTRRF